MLRIHRDRPGIAPLIAALSLAALPLMGGLAGCGRSTIHVVGVMQQSSEMRPLPSVPLGGYQKLRLFVHAAADQASTQYGSPDCGFAMLEGSGEGDDLKNAACVPVDTLNAVIGIVRQRLRSYGIKVVRDATDPYDYEVAVSVTGAAPRRADATLAKAVAMVRFKSSADPRGGTLMSGIATAPASAAFATVASDCRLKDGDLSSFYASSAQPMTPGFDVQALADDAVDNALRCDELARFFESALTRFPKPAATPAPAAP